VTLLDFQTTKHKPFQLIDPHQVLDGRPRWTTNRSTGTIRIRVNADQGSNACDCTLSQNNVSCLPSCRLQGHRTQKRSPRHAFSKWRTAGARIAYHPNCTLTLPRHRGVREQSTRTLLKGGRFKLARARELIQVQMRSAHMRSTAGMLCAWAPYAYRRMQPRARLCFDRVSPSLLLRSQFCSTAALWCKAGP